MDPTVVTSLHSRPLVLLTSIQHPATLIHPTKVASFQQDVQSSMVRRRARQALGSQLPPLLLSAIEGVSDAAGEAQLQDAVKMCYGCTLLYMSTRTEVYATRAAAIIQAWSTTCKAITCPDAPWVAAWSTASFSRCYELLMHVWPGGASSPLLAMFVPWVRSTLLPHLKGSTDKDGLQWGYFNHWHTTILEARLQFALVTDDIRECNWCIVQYQLIMKTYISETGFIGDSMRDSDRCCYGLAGLVHMAQLLNNQGVDMGYTIELFRALELHAAMYACARAPPGYAMQQFKVFNWIQPSAWEVALSHYEHAAGISMPNTRLLLAKIRPCNFHMHFGFDTITHGT